MSDTAEPCAWTEHDWRFVSTTSLEAHEGMYTGLPPGQVLYYVEGMLRCDKCGALGQAGIPSRRRASCPCCGKPR